MSTLPPHMVFSYWTLVWFILYYFKLTSFSPKFAITVGILENIVLFILMVIWGTSSRTIIWFVIINTLIKIMPFYYLRNESYNLKDIYFTFGLFFLFIVWLHINNQSLIGNAKLIYDSLIYGNDNTPFMNLLHKIKNNFKRYEII
jgi:hypothetical protein